MEGCQVIAKALKQQGIQYVFGVVGIPVVEIAEACMQEGIHYYGMRNEQSASYAAGAVGYLTGRPGVCLVVSGPGLVHALAGMSNAWSNNWPMIVIGGASEVKQENMGAFQEFPQVEACRLYTKFTCRPGSIQQIPGVIEKACRLTIYGRPGAAYIDIPADYVTTKVPENTLVFPPKCRDPPKCMADPKQVADAAKLIAGAKKPLFIIGKGAQYARAENEISRLVKALNVPFLPTPMGKGLLSDDHPNCVAAARSTALKSADVVVLLGARLNWILHFGQPPRFRPDVKFIQIDIAPEEFGTNTPGEKAIHLWGHLPLVVDQLSRDIQQAASKVKLPDLKPWWDTLSVKVAKNKEVNEKLMQDEELPMTYYRAYKEIKDYLPKEAFMVCEGANTMDIARTVFNQYYPRNRLDAGSFGTMGLGLGFAIAAQVVDMSRRVICIEGDSAFGFSGMEVETACRMNLPILFVVINNNGIYAGMDEEGWKSWDGQKPSTTLVPNARYDMMATAFGGKGYYCTTPAELQSAVKECMAAWKNKTAKCTVINVAISPYGTRKQQEFEWLTRSEAKL